MVLKKEIRMTTHLNEKSRLYLEELGFLDRRTGRKTTKERNLNGFINELIVRACEENKHHMKHVASSEDLMASWRKHQVSMRNREIGRLNQEISSIVNWKG